MRCTEPTEMPVALAIARPVQCVVWCGGSVQVSATTRAVGSAAIGALPGLRVLTQSGPTAAFLCRCAKVVDGGVGRRVEPEDRSGACDAALSLQCAILIHVEWRIFPEYVEGSDQFMLRHRARWQGLAGKQPQGERQHVVAVA